jgi:hypothetical protein
VFDYAATIAAARRDHDSATFALRCPQGAFLVGQGGNVTSQCGEDGLIAAVFARIGTRNRWCFEVGAADGLRTSNTWALRMDGWRSVLIEADPVEFARLRNNTSYNLAEAGTVAVHARVTPNGPDSLDSILTSVGAPADLDFGIIDIDGQDLHVWAGLEQFRPRVMLVEYNPSGDGIQGGTTEWQAGYDAIADLGRQKGYLCLATTGHNALFVLEGEL